MKDASLAIRQAYMTALSLIGVDVYDTVPPLGGNSLGKYIVLSTQDQDGTRYKEKFSPNCTMTVDIIDRQDRPTGRLTVDGLASDVLEIINPVSGELDLGSDFDCIETRLVSSGSIYSTSGTHHIYRKILVLNHKVVEKRI